MRNKIWPVSYRSVRSYQGLEIWFVIIISDRNTSNFSESVLNVSTFASFASNSRSFPARRTCSSRLEKRTFDRLSVKALDHSCVKVHSRRSSFFKRFQWISRFYPFFLSLKRHRNKNVLFKFWVDLAESLSLPDIGES